MSVVLLLVLLFFLLFESLFLFSLLFLLSVFQSLQSSLLSSLRLFFCLFFCRNLGLFIKFGLSSFSQLSFPFLNSFLFGLLFFENFELLLFNHGLLVNHQLCNLGSFLRGNVFSLFLSKLLCLTYRFLCKNFSLFLLSGFSELFSKSIFSLFDAFCFLFSLKLISFLFGLFSFLFG